MTAGRIGGVSVAVIAVLGRPGESARVEAGLCIRSGQVARVSARMAGLSRSGGGRGRPGLGLGLVVAAFLRSDVFGRLRPGGRNRTVGCDRRSAREFVRGVEAAHAPLFLNVSCRSGPSGIRRSLGIVGQAGLVSTRPSGARVLRRAGQGTLSFRRRAGRLGIGGGDQIRPGIASCSIAPFSVGPLRIGCRRPGRRGAFGIAAGDEPAD
ncbi:hypothetical protein [Rhodovulum sp. 12E13]|uniref:hypothetical protein n=1 Tax=Rhodovulum sp. 12E13 TaxID=2203891 RepID=UPI0013145FFC|nr:hypothetical protein [Rhodovulum sp. 12E13]